MLLLCSRLNYLRIFVLIPTDWAAKWRSGDRVHRWEGRAASTPTPNTVVALFEIGNLIIVEQKQTQARRTTPTRIRGHSLLGCACQQAGTTGRGGAASARNLLQIHKREGRKLETFVQDLVKHCATRVGHHTTDFNLMTINYWDLFIHPSVMDGLGCTINKLCVSL